MADKERYREYYSGFKAYDDWIGALVDEPAFKKLTSEDLKGIAHANAFCYASLIDARASAARYLHSVKEDLGTDAAPHLLAAADIYERIAEKLKPVKVVYYWEVEKKPWTPAMRRHEAVILKSVALLEKQAVQELRQAREAAK